LTGAPADVAFDDWVDDPARERDVRFTEADHELDIARRLEQQAAESRAARERTPDEQLAARIAMSTAAVCGIAPDQLRGKGRGGVEVLARSAAIYCAMNRGLTEQVTAKALCITQQRVSAVRRGELPDAARMLALLIERHLQQAVAEASQVVEVVH
jgi:hypothetical protein